MLFQRSKGEPELSAAVGFPIQSRIKAISAENYNQTKSEATYTSCDFTRRMERKNGEKTKSLGNMVQKLRKIVLNCIHEYHSY